MHGPNLDRARLSARLASIVRAFDATFVEREAAARMLLLALVAGQHVLLLGPPGTGKSMLARAASEAFASDPAAPREGAADDRVRYFEYLLTRFSHPDELFGPLSIQGLKDEDYRRLTDGYLPDAHIAFLDEVFKASSAVLNTLLGILNERVFHCGARRLRVPLIGLVGASNEAPQLGDPASEAAGGDGLAALWDRFLVRLDIAPIEDAEAFVSVVTGQRPALTIAEADRLHLSELHAIRREAAGVAVPRAFADALVALRDGLSALGIAASDRRFRQAVELARVAAWTSGRDEVGPVELLLLGSCFGIPGQSDGALRGLLGRTVDALVLPSLSARLEAAWEAVEGDEEARDVEAAYAARLARVDAFERELDQREAEVLTQRDALFTAIAESPWLDLAPGRLAAAFVLARRELEAYREVARRHRAELGGETTAFSTAPGAAVDAQLARMKKVQALSREGRERDPREARDLEVALWLMPPDSDPDAWIPVSNNGLLLFDAAPLIAGRIQRKLIDRATSEGRELDEATEWHRTVTTLVLDPACWWALLSDWPSLQHFLADRGIAPGSPALSALRALSGELRRAGVPRLPPRPSVDLAPSRDPRDPDRAR